MLEAAAATQSLESVSAILSPRQNDARAPQEDAGKVREARRTLAAHRDLFVSLVWPGDKRVCQRDHSAPAVYRPLADAREDGGEIAVIAGAGSLDRNLRLKDYNLV